VKVLIADGLKPTWGNYPASWGSTPDSVMTGGNATYVIPGTDGVAVNRVPFHIAFAFCIWDGGRLPAKLELMLAFHGGDGTTAYPWGDTPAPADLFTGRPAAVPTTYNDTMWPYIGIPVGSHPASVGRFGHHDLAVGLEEYVRDAAGASGVSPTGGFVELANDQFGAGDPTKSAASFAVPGRRDFGGYWQSPGTHDVYPAISGAGIGTVGFRCARAP
jgi:formylglycine-generating enzyme required for sulfatase activity